MTNSDSSFTSVPRRLCCPSVRAEPAGSLLTLECDLALGTLPHPHLCSAKGSQVTPTCEFAGGNDPRADWEVAQGTRGDRDTHTHQGAAGNDCPESQPKNFLYPLCQLPLLIVSQSLSPPQLCPAPTCSSDVFPQRSRRFKAQDSRCTGKVGSTQPSVVLGGLGAPGHHNPDSKALQ